MIFSEAFPFTYKGRPAQLRVIRNNGFCWGRIVCKRGGELDVWTRSDQYERTDEAAAAFIRAAKRGSVEPAVGSPIGWGS